MAKARDGFGGLVGILIFLAGVLLLGVTFFEAFKLFSTPAPKVIGQMNPGEPFDANKAANAGFELVWRVIMLLAMSWVSSVIANRGIKMYQSSRIPVREEGLAEAETPAQQEPELRQPEEKSK